jgi:putative ABC transport system permease protein
VLTAQLPFAEHRFAGPDQLHAFMRNVIAHVGALPGVREVAFTDRTPMRGVKMGKFFQIAGRPRVGRAQRPLADFKVITPAYFQALGLRLRRGRTLRDADRATAPLVAVINETMARMYFNHDDAVGQHLLMEQFQLGMTQFGAELPWEIVGIIADERLTPFDDHREHPAIYVTNEQNPSASNSLVVRTSNDPSQMEPSLRLAIAEVDKDQAVTDVKTLAQLTSESMGPDRLRSSLLGLFAVVALLLAAIGIYGVIAYTIVQRTHELGIRAALGASPASLVRLVIRVGMALTAVGLALGVRGNIRCDQCASHVLVWCPVV